MMRLPASDPFRLPSPPTATTMSAGIRMEAPMGGKADWMGPAMTPDSPASAVPNANTRVNTRWILIPMPADISES
jgi:hypothetical protein